ncbi:Reverse transcriptase domain-containing protein, partial [Aphis craccivora]
MMGIFKSIFYNFFYDFFQMFFIKSSLTAAGFDGISIKIIKHIANKIRSPLTHIYNLSIKNSIFLEKFEMAIIKSLFKMGI